MKNPKLIVKPFAKNGQKNVIPENYETSMESNQATWDQGFGQITMLPVAAGGLPPKGQDFNGIFNQISENIVYLSQGGRFKFSAEYAEAIGGYPKGAILQSDDEKKEYLSLIDNNKVDFNTVQDISASWKLVNTDDLLTQIASKQPKGDYATKTELNSGLAGKQPTGDYATKTEVGLKLDKTAVVQPVGASTTNVMSQKSVTDELNKKFDKTGGTITGGVTIQSTDDFPTLNLLGNNGDSTRVQANTSDPDYMLTVVTRDSTGKVKKTVRIPNEDGTTLLSGQVYSNQDINNLIDGVKNTALKQAAGWHKDESTGVITQWGEVNKINDSQPYIMQFPIPFPTAVTAIVTQVISNETGVLNITPRIRTPSTNRTQFAIQHGVSEGRYYWIAKGY